jgi:hypothetical protein
MRKVCTLFILYISVILLKAQGWSHLGSGTNALNANNSIESIAIDPSGNVYAAGDFTNSNGKYYVAKWNGTNWNELGTGNNALNGSSFINSVAIDPSGNVYAAGSFLDQNSYAYVAKWNGTNWTQLGTGKNALNATSVGTVLVDKSGNIYAGCFYLDSTVENCVMQWNGTNWNQVGRSTNSLNVSNGGIKSMALDNSGNIYIGGFHYVTKWDGISWTILQTATSTLNTDNNSINAIAVDNNGNVYAAGSFYDSYERYYVSKWNGQTWNELGTGVFILNANSPITAVAVDNSGNVYAGGQFTTGYGSNYYRYVAHWNGSSWSNLGSVAEITSYFNTLIDVVKTDPLGNVYAAGLVYDSTGHQCVLKYTAASTTTGIATSLNKNADIKIYPNPSTGMINIPDLSENVQMSIFNILGETVYSQQVNKGTFSLDLSHLSSGMYTLVFTGQQSTYTPVKWVKE